MSLTQQSDSARRRSLHARRLPLTDSDRQLAQLSDLEPNSDFQAALTSEGLWPLQPTSIDVLQINVGRLCNQTCRHSSLGQWHALEVTEIIHKIERD